MMKTEIKQTPHDQRDAKASMKRGWKRTCPNCGTGPVFNGYLQVQKSCKVCGEELHHQRADDGPAYITILIVGHIVGSLMLFTYETWRLDALVLFLIYGVMTVAMCLFLLPRIKGALIGLQWAKGMHGFGLPR